MRNDNCAAAVLRATRALQGRLVGIRNCVTVAAMLACSPAAQMRGRTRRLQRRRKQKAGNREQQQNTGDQPLHWYDLERTPSALSIADAQKSGNITFTNS
jgi:hypothetical protein